MKEKEFDSLVRTRLKNHESAVPAGTWERITHETKKRRKGLAPRFYWLTLAVLLIGFVGIYYSSQRMHQPEKDFALNKTDVTNTDTKDLIRSNNKGDHSTGAFDVSNYEHSPEVSDGRAKHMLAKSLMKVRKEDKKFSSDRETFKPDENVLLDKGKAFSAAEDNNTGNMIKKEVPGEGTKAAQSEPAASTPPTPIESGYDKFSLELFTSPSVPINSVSSENKAYEQALKKSGSMQLSYTVGARISYRISKRVSAKTGVQFSQVNEKMSFTDSAGKTSTSNNHYRNIGVPLLLGYKIASANKLDIFVNTGIILNVASKYEGVIPSASGQPIDIKTENVYNTNASADLFLGINLSKKLNSRADFFVEPWLNYRLKNMVSHYYSFDQKINTLGLSLGLRYRLYKNETLQ